MTTTDTLPEVGAAPVAPPHRTSRGRRRFLLVVALLAAAVGLLLYKGLLSSLDYFDTVDQALAHRAQLGTTSFRLEGVVVGGTMHGTSNGGERFAIEGADGATIDVRNTGAPPQLFQAAIPVVVVGRFASATSDLFLSNQIEVRHSSSYIAAHPGRVRAPNGSVR